MKIFLSHVHEEGAIALCLKKWIEDTFPGECEVFVSSDPSDIRAGAPWKQKVREALDGAALMILLVSPRSLGRPWINFEAGCGWVRELDLLSVCHAGQDKGSLPPPLHDFQNLNLSDPDFGKQLMGSIGDRLKKKVPPIDYALMARELDSVSSKAPDPAAKSSAAGAEELLSKLPNECIGILELLASLEAADDQDEGRYVTLANLADRVKLKKQKLQYFLEVLESADLIWLEHNMLRPTSYHVSTEGRRFLVEIGRL